MQEKSQSYSLELFLSPHPLCIEIYWTSLKSLSPPGNRFLLCYKAYGFGSLGVTYLLVNREGFCAERVRGACGHSLCTAPRLGFVSSPHAPWNLSVSSCFMPLTESVTVVFLSSSLPPSCSLFRLPFLSWSHRSSSSVTPACCTDGNTPFSCVFGWLAPSTPTRSQVERMAWMTAWWCLISKSVILIQSKQVWVPLGFSRVPKGPGI